MTSQTVETYADDSAAVTPQQPSLIRSSLIMAAGTLLSRILGFVRAAMLVAAIGSIGGGVMAAFQTANTLPNMVFNILAAGVLDAVLVPQIVRALKRPDGTVFVNRLLTAAGLILFALTVVTMIGAPLLVMMTAASYSAEIRALSIAFSLICLPQIFFYGLYNLLGEVLNARGVFGPYTWAPVVNNVVGIAGLGVFLFMWGSHPTILPIADFTSPQFWVLAGSATLGVICQALVLVVPLRRAGVKLRLDFNFRETSFGSIPTVAMWTFGILAVSQIGIFSTSNLVAFADAWANEFQPDISALTSSSELVVGNAAYATAFMIFMVPQSLIAISLATALFTRLADAASSHDHVEVAKQFHIGVRSISTLNLLAAAILTAGAIPMMQMVLPAASPIIVESYAWVLQAMLPGVASIGLILMSQRVFFAYEDAKPAFMTGIVPNILQVIVGWSLFWVLPPAWWVVGAAVAEAVCRMSQGFISLFVARRANEHIDAGAMLQSFLRAFCAAIVAAGAGFVVMYLLGWHTTASSVPGRILVSFVHLSLVALVAIPVYWVVLRILSPAETREVGRMIVTRFPVPSAVRYFLVGAESIEPKAEDTHSLDVDVTPLIAENEGSMSDELPGASGEDVSSQSKMRSPFAPPANFSDADDDTAPTPRIPIERRSLRQKLSDSQEQGSALTTGGAHRLHQRYARPAVIFFAVFTLLAGLWAVRTATSPVNWNAPSLVIDRLEAQSKGQSDTSADKPTDDAPVVTAPKISSVEVISWRDDQGDNENHAIRMIDNDPATDWHSRQFEGSFGDDTGITIVVRLEKPAVVNEVSLQMHDKTSGGEIFLQRNAGNPRKGEILAKDAMNPQTVLKPGAPVELDSFVLRFGSVPQGPDDALWAWIYEIGVK